jgi:hypothetical protein
MQERNGALLEEVRELRALAAAPQALPEAVSRSLSESRDALNELSRNLSEQEAVNASLRAECDAFRSSADNASNAAHGAMVAALRARQAASGESPVADLRVRNFAMGGSHSLSDESVSPLSARAARVFQSGDAALARQHSTAVSGSSVAGPAAADKLRAVIANKDATISALRSECLQLSSHVAALQAELSIYRKVDVYSETFHKECVAMSRSKQQQQLALR